MVQSRLISFKRLHNRVVDIHNITDSTVYENNIYMRTAADNINSIYVEINDAAIMIFCLENNIRF